MMFLALPERLIWFIQLLKFPSGNLCSGLAHIHWSETHSTALPTILLKIFPNHCLFDGGGADS
jgi:hypothetical protein